MFQEKSRRRNVFVLCLDDLHLKDLENIPDRAQFNFHGLLTREDFVGKSGRELEASILRAEEILRNFAEPVDAIIGYWDFPVTTTAAILCEKFGLPSPGLTPLLKCAHKYWSRLEQRQYIPEHTPRFCAVDPFATAPCQQISLEFPFWIKPVCGYGSILGFRINNRREFNQAIEITRRSIGLVGDAFNTILNRVDTSALAGVGGNHMIAEELLHGIELAPEGYVQDGKVKVHGVVDMVRAPNHKSFKCYRYPSSHPRSIQNRTIEATRKLVQGMGYDNACFNVEFFWDRDNDEMRIVELNTRISQSHSDLMYKVDGMSNYEVAIHVALGNTPRYEHGKGQFNYAAKFLLRRFEPDDALCISAPGESALARLRQQQPQTSVLLQVHEGMHLSDMVGQDPYSWVLAELVIGGDDIGDLNRKFEEASALLPFEFVPARSATSRRSRSKVHD